MPVTVVRNLPVESAALNALRRAAWARVGDQDWEPILQRSLGWVAAVAGGDLIGFVNLAWDGGAHAFLLDTTVHPAYQHRGLGRALVREAAAMARARGAKWLHVDYDDELAGFYKGCGFRPVAAGLLDLTQSPPAQEDRGGD